jgi:hypothetical protein
MITILVRALNNDVFPLYNYIHLLFLVPLDELESFSRLLC